MVQNCVRFATWPEKYCLIFFYNQDKNSQIIDEILYPDQPTQEQVAANKSSNHFHISTFCLIKDKHVT